MQSCKGSKAEIIEAAHLPRSQVNTLDPAVNYLEF